MASSFATFHLTPFAMTFFCYITLAGVLAGSLASYSATAQSAAPATGRLHYEFAQRVDKDKVKIKLFDPNGQEINIDGPGSTIELPTSMSAQKSLVYSSRYAKEEQPQGLQMVGGNINMVPGKTPAAATRSLLAPISSTQYFDLGARTATTVTTIGGTAYAAPPAPVPAPPTGWQDLPQTKKIAGYLCHKVTVPFKKENYTLWVTTELPFAYSPVRELTPTQGVVLALSSDQEEYTATKLAAEPVAEADVRPSPQARPVTEAEFKELRAKATADQRQRVLEQMANQPRP
jgi:GLPGLI family protein